MPDPKWDVHIVGEIPGVERLPYGIDANNNEEYLQYELGELKAYVSKDMKSTYEAAMGVDRDKNFWQRVGAFFRAENKAGRIAKSVKDFALLFTPKWVNIGYNTVDEFIVDRIIEDKKSQLTTTTTMAQSNGLWQWIKDRLKEPSTYEGVAVVLGVIGASIEPEALEMIGMGVVSVIGGIRMIKKEKESK